MGLSFFCVSQQFNHGADRDDKQHACCCFLFGGTGGVHGDWRHCFLISWLKVEESVIKWSSDGRPQ